jgi:hypothetical protein
MRELFADVDGDDRSHEFFVLLVDCGDLFAALGAGIGRKTWAS